MEQSLLTLLADPEYTPANLGELLALLSLKPTQKARLEDALHALVDQGLIVRTKGNRFIQAREADLIPGVIQITRQGRGFVQPDQPGIGEISIPEASTATAMHGDRVLVRLNVKPQGLLKKAPDAASGKVVRILERKRSQFVGTLQAGKQFLYVIPDDPRFSHNIIVPPPRDVGRRARPGDKVVVELTDWENRHTSPEGEVIEVLGAADAEGVDMLSVLRHYALPLHFPKEVLAEAETIAKSRPDNQPSAADIKGREDCRGHNVITIDPDDAKDFDDAICIEPFKDGWKVWVHIADVSYYVRPGGPLDEEAHKRGNSTYLVDRVIPMLPEALSNELCSLKPNIDRLTKCVEFHLSGDGAVVSSKFYPAVIRSKRRFSYQQALAVIEGKATDAIETMLQDAHQVAQRIRKRRFKNGSLDLDFPENKIRLDDHGRILRIDRMENDVSHQLIEEYMLLANEAVAAHLMRIDRPSIYRIHEAPKDKKLQEYRDDVLSHHIPCGNLSLRPEVQKLLARLNSMPIGAALKIGFLRSLMRARYAVEPLGHYGLAKTRYTHFTSPIRRYSDLVVHRVLFEKQQPTVAAMREIADHLTDTERNSADAERDSKDVKLYAWLTAQLDSGSPAPYDALVTDVRNFGFFVDVPGLGMSGAVPLSSIQDDFYTLDTVRNELVGRHTRRIIKLGDRLRVQIYKLDKFKKQVDFCLVPTPGKPAAKSKGRADGGEQTRGREADRGRVRDWDRERRNERKGGKNREGDRDRAGGPARPGTSKPGASRPGSAKPDERTRTDERSKPNGTRKERNQNKPKRTMPPGPKPGSSGTQPARPKKRHRGK